MPSAPGDRTLCRWYRRARVSRSRQSSRPAYRRMQPGNAHGNMLCSRSTKGFPSESAARRTRSLQPRQDGSGLRLRAHGSGLRLRSHGSRWGTAVPGVAGTVACDCGRMAAGAGLRSRVWRGTVACGCDRSWQWPATAGAWQQVRDCGPGCGGARWPAVAIAHGSGLRLRAHGSRCGTAVPGVARTVACDCGRGGTGRGRMVRRIPRLLSGGICQLRAAARHHMPTSTSNAIDGSSTRCSSSETMRPSPG